MSRIAGIDRLVAMRRSGNKPVLPVWLWIGFPKAKYNGNGIELEMAAPSRSADIRALVSLDVMLCAAKYSPQLFDFFELLKVVAKSVTLWVEEWNEDVDSVILWDRKNGQRTLGELKK